MDWSLALVSQGIESTIEHSAEAGWGLTVASDDHAHALAVIRQYRLENRHWPWRQKFRQKILFDWGSFGWAVLMCLFYWLQTRNGAMQQDGIMDGIAVGHGQWWRLVTAIFLHANLGHLAENVGIGVVLLGLAMGRFGTGIGLLAAFLAGIGGNVTTWLLYGNHQSLGASGMIMGSLGLLAAPPVFVPRRHPGGWRYLLIGIAAGAMLFVLWSSSPETDVLAHLGGFVAGVLLGWMLTLAPRLGQNTAANFVAGALFSLMVIVSWGFALAGGRSS